MPEWRQDALYAKFGQFIQRHGHLSHSRSSISLLNANQDRCGAVCDSKIIIKLLQDFLGNFFFSSIFAISSVTWRNSKAFLRARMIPLSLLASSASRKAS